MKNTSKEPKKYKNMRNRRDKNCKENQTLFKVRESILLKIDENLKRFLIEDREVNAQLLYTVEF